MQNSQSRFKTTITAKAGDQIEQRVLNDKKEPLMTIPSKVINEHLSNQYSAYSEIEWELEDSKKLFQKAKLTASEESVRSALFVAAIITYGRIFNTADGRNGIKLEGTSHWLGDNPIAKKRHNELMEFRNKLIAHTGHSPYRSCETSIVTDIVAHENGQVLPNSLPKNTILGVGTFKIEFAGFSNEDIDATIRFLDSIKIRVQKKKIKLEERLTNLALKVLIEK